MSGAAFRGAISQAVAHALELHKSGMSTRQAAKEAGCSHGAVCVHLYGKIKGRKVLTTGDDALAALVIPRTRRELAEALGVPRTTADHHVARLLALGVIQVAGNRKTETGYSPIFRAIPGAVIPPVKMPMHPNRRQMLQALASGPLTAAQIAASLGRTPQTIRRLLLDCQPALVDVAGHGDSDKGHMPLTWRLTAAGRDAIKQASSAPDSP